MSGSINTVLGELEEDLKRLQAARDQVESVLSSNHELSVALGSLMTNTEALISEVKNATEGAVVQFSEKLAEAHDAMDETVTYCLSRIDDSVKGFEKANEKFQETTDTKIVEVSEVATRAIAEQKAENIKTLNEILETNNNIKKLISELLDLRLSSALESINSRINQAQGEVDSQLKTLRTIGVAGIAILLVVMVLLLIQLFL